jgi:hypothetical protein
VCSSSCVLSPASLALGDHLVQIRCRTYLPQSIFHPRMLRDELNGVVEIPRLERSAYLVRSELRHGIESSKPAALNQLHGASVRAAACVVLLGTWFLEIELVLESPWGRAARHGTSLGGWAAVAGWRFVENSPATGCCYRCRSAPRSHPASPWYTATCGHSHAVVTAGL